MDQKAQTLDQYLESRCLRIEDKKRQKIIYLKKITNGKNNCESEQEIRKRRRNSCVSTSGVKSYVLLSSSQDKSCRCACINFPWVKYATETDPTPDPDPDPDIDPDSNAVSDTMSVFVCLTADSSELIIVYNK